MTTRSTLHLRDGRELDVHDAGGPPEAFTIVWHGGSPQTGAPLQPLKDAALARGIRLITYARPSYGGSTALRDRDVASAASDVEQVADTLGLEQFAVMGHSGGGPHALACAALIDRVSAAATFASVAPFDAAIAWFAGMAGDGPSLRAAAEGREAREAFEETAGFDPSSFIDRDYQILRGEWGAMGKDGDAATEFGSDGLVADDLAFVRPWGFEVSDITAPVLVVQGGRDRVIPASHGLWLVDRMDDVELWLRPREGHLSILDSVPLAMDWLIAHT